MTTPAKLYGKDLSEYDEVDVDELLSKLSPEEINILAKEVDPDVSLSQIKEFPNLVKLNFTCKVRKCLPTMRLTIHICHENCSQRRGFHATR